MKYHNQPCVSGTTHQHSALSCCVRHPLRSWFSSSHLLKCLASPHSPSCLCVHCSATLTALSVKHSSHVFTHPSCDRIMWMEVHHYRNPFRGFISWNLLQSKLWDNALTDGTTFYVLCKKCAKTLLNTTKDLHKLQKLQVDRAVHARQFLNLILDIGSAIRWLKCLGWMSALKKDWNCRMKGEQISQRPRKGRGREMMMPPLQGTSRGNFNQARW